MPNVQVFIPGGAQQGNAIDIADFAAEAEKQLARLNADESLSEEIKTQASAAVEAAIQLVEGEFAGVERVIAVVSTRINKDAVPEGTGHIVSIEISSRAAAAVEAAEAVAAVESAPDEPSAPDAEEEVPANRQIPEQESKADDDTTGSESGNPPVAADAAKDAASS